LPATACSTILERQQQSLRIELLGTAAELRALQLAQQMPQAIHLRQRLVALSDRSVPLRPRGRDQCLQRVDVCRKLICDLAHVQELNLIRGPMWNAMSRLIQSVAVLTTSLSAARCRGPADATNPFHPPAQRAAMRSAASPHR
jgi:hypothetical protein